MVTHIREAVVVRRRSDDVATTVTVPSCGVRLDAVERALVEFALKVEAGNRSRAARWLGLTRSALLYRSRKHGLRQKDRAIG